MRMLLWKDFKNSKWWIAGNVLIITVLGLLGVYLSKYKDFPGFIFPILSGVGVVFWSFVSGMSHYFNDDNGNAREILNTLPIPRWKILFSKMVILFMENVVYWLLIFTFLAVSFYMVSPFTVDSISFRTGIITYIPTLLTTFTISTISLSMAAFTKELPARWFLSVLLVIVCLVVLQFIPFPKIVVNLMKLDMNPYIDLGYILKNFLFSMVIFGSACFWVEKRTL